jgi:hypothetical protein
MIHATAKYSRINAADYGTPPKQKFQNYGLFTSGFIASDISTYDSVTLSIRGTTEQSGTDELFFLRTLSSIKSKEPEPPAILCMILL